MQAQKDYNALAEQLTDLAAYRQRRDELHKIELRASDAYDDIMIAWKKLTPSQSATFEKYMNENVAPINEIGKQHRQRFDAMFRQ
jgi:hypothetical protein